MDANVPALGGSKTAELVEILIQRDTVITRSILSTLFTNTPHSSNVRMRYVVSFVGSASDWYSGSLPAKMYAIPSYNRPRYNGAQL